MADKSMTLYIRGETDDSEGVCDVGCVHVCLGRGGGGGPVESVASIDKRVK